MPKKTKSDLPAATLRRGCSLLMRIKSAEFKLLKLVESSMNSYRTKIRTNFEWKNLE